MKQSRRFVVLLWDLATAFEKVSHGKLAGLAARAGSPAHLLRVVLNAFRSRLFVDGVEQKQTRSIAGNTWLFSNLGTYVGWLGSGAHTFAVLTHASRALGNRCAGGDVAVALALALAPALAPSPPAWPSSRLKTGKAWRPSGT